MKPIKQKTCKREGCNNKFTPYKSTDKYCSPSCFYSGKEERKPIAQKAIKRRSTKRASEETIYLKLNRIFLAKQENSICPVMLHLHGMRVRTDQVHHKAGRIGKLLLYTSYWLAVSEDGHTWIHDHPEEAYKIGFLIHSATVRI